jgi:ATP-dependent exoDNAse (exonuclease V) alpha subunit
LALADSQKAALRVALVSNVTAITGGPGVGKTTLLNSLLKVLIAKAVTIALCAPTGRAAKRLSESTGLDELVLAYATTIHKSQGSEYPAVVIPLTTQHYPMLQRNLVYTGVTRGKRLVVLVGQRKALAIAIKGARTRRRWSKLREWLACQ